MSKIILPIENEAGHQRFECSWCKRQLATINLDCLTFRNWFQKSSVTKSFAFINNIKIDRSIILVCSQGVDGIE
jgi:hypothetical protein